MTTTASATGNSLFVLMRGMLNSTTLKKIPEGTTSFDNIFSLLQGVTDEIEDASMYTLDPDSKLFFLGYQNMV